MRSGSRRGWLLLEPCGFGSPLLSSFLRACCPAGYETPIPDRQKGYSPKSAKITPKYMNAVLHIGDVTVRVGTDPDQARVTGRIG